MSERTAYPLSWPAGWKRTPGHQRRRASFHSWRSEYRAATQFTQAHTSKFKQELSVAAALERLRAEVARLGSGSLSSLVVSTNLTLRLDGLPKSGQANPTDPGAAVYFKFRKRDRALACDKWDRVADNIVAIAKFIEAMRGQERWGVGSLEQAFVGFTALPPSAVDWRIVLGFAADATPSAEAIERHFRELALKCHPDRGGSEGEMAKVNAARDLAIAEVQS